MRLVRITVPLAAVGAWLVFAPSAMACSCAPQTEPLTRESIRDSDAAVIAKLVEIKQRGDYESRLTFDVRKAFKRHKRFESNPRLTLINDHLNSCAIPERIDRKYGMFLYRVDGRWNTGLCSLVSPRKLRRAAHTSAHHSPRIGCQAA